MLVKMPAVCPAEFVSDTNTTAVSLVGCAFETLTAMALYDDSVVCTGAAGYVND